VVDAVTRDTHTCLDAETIAAFIDGRLTGGARERVVEHLADCADCYSIFSESVRATADQTMAAPVPARPWFRDPRLLGLAAAAALVVALVPAALQWQSSPQRHVRALVAAVGTERTFEPRLTGGFAYGPLKVTRGAAVEQSPEVRIAAANIDKAAAARRTPANLDAQGISFLVTGKPEEAIAALEEAAKLMPPNAQLLSDLSAAYLVRGESGRRSADFTTALGFADRAVKAEPLLAEAWFNRALAVTHLSTSTEEIRHAWEDYLRVDGGSPWAAEANDRLARLHR